MVTVYIILHIGMKVEAYVCRVLQSITDPVDARMAGNADCRGLKPNLVIHWIAAMVILAIFFYPK